MKYLLGVCLGLMVSGCGSSSGGGGDSTGSLIGSWLSNCHIYEGVETATGDPVYAISRLTFAEATYVDDVASYSDMDCVTPDGAADESFTSSYVVGEEVAASDGLQATRMTITAIVPDQPELELVTEAVFRVSAAELNFAEFAVDATPEFDYRITYTK